MTSAPESPVKAKKEQTPEVGARRFGAFGGVFTPNVLTILGVILFLRAGWCVGVAGLHDGVMILLLANGITMLTALSISAISTNGTVGAGGVYYLISRSLGLEIGGSIGTPLYLAQAISVAFYLLGFAESVQFLLDSMGVNLLAMLPESWAFLASTRTWAMSMLAVFLLLSWRGAEIVIRTQYVIMTLLGLAILSFFLGASPWNTMMDNLRANWSPAYQGNHTFWTVFAIFFPAVTGITSGVSMSGELKDPSRSIPRGTIAAVLVTFAIYGLQLVWLSMNATRSELVGNTMVVRDTALFGPLIYVGLWAATLSSGLACLMAAPRTLQALARDRVAPRFLGRGSAPTQEPRLATAATALVAAAGIMAGHLDIIAPIITMFYLTTYGMVNLVAGLERLVSNPSFRPTFRVHWLPSLAGFAGCVLAMFLINTLATAAAVIIIAVIYSLLTQRKFQTSWGDMRSGMWFALTRLGLLRLDASRKHVRNWRPAILVLVSSVDEDRQMAEFANRLEARRGILFLARVVPGDWQKLLPRQQAFEQSLARFIHDNRLAAVAKTVLADTFEEGVAILLQVAGLGQFEPNTVMLNWNQSDARRDDVRGAVRRILELRRNLVVYASAKLNDDALEPVIDVWWYSRDNGSLMVTLAHLLQKSSYGDHRIRVLRIIRSESGRDETRQSLKQRLAELRYDVDVEVIVSEDPPLDVIARKSRRSAVVFVGLKVEGEASAEQPAQQQDVDLMTPYARVASNIYGHLLLTKSWQDLHR